MHVRHFQVTAQELRAGSPDYRKETAGPNPVGNRAQRRAWARFAKAKRAVPASPETHGEQTADGGQRA